MPECCSSLPCISLRGLPNLIIGIDWFKNNDRTHHVPGTVPNAGDALRSVATMASPWAEPSGREMHCGQQ